LTSAFIVHGVEGKQTAPLILDTYDDWLRTSGWRAKWERWNRPGQTPRLAQACDWLRTIYLIDWFNAGQFLADLRHHQPLRNAPDIDTFAAIGRGSAKGLNIVLGRDPKASWTQDSWLVALRHLADQIWPRLDSVGLPHLHLMNVQNVLCEVSKIYCHVHFGDGIKQTYKGTARRLSGAALEARLAELRTDTRTRFAALGIRNLGWLDGDDRLAAE
jgi:hypothetical protein